MSRNRGDQDNRRRWNADRALSVGSVAVASAVLLFAASTLVDTDSEEPTPVASTPSATESGTGSRAGTSQGAVSPAGGVRKPATEATQVWSLAVQPLTQPVSVGEVAVLYARQSGGTASSAERGQQGAQARNSVALIGVDPKTGAELWRRDATVSAISPATPLQVVQTGGADSLVAYLEPVGAEPARARLVVANPKTGRTVGKGPAGVYSSAVAACGPLSGSLSAGSSTSAVARRAATPGSLLCGDYRSGIDADPQRFAFDVATKKFTADVEGRAGVRPVGPDGLSDTGARSPERIGVLDDNEFAWTMPVVAYFPEVDTMDAGWRFGRFGDSFIGSLGQHRIYGQDFNFGETNTAAFQAATGRIDWFVRDTSYACFEQMWVPGDVPFRCHFSGSIDADADTGAAQYQDVEVAIEGFDPDDGVATWEVPLGTRIPFILGQRMPALLNATTIKVSGARGVIDLATGQRRNIRKSDPQMCPSVPKTSFDLYGAYDGQVLLEPCGEADLDVEILDELGQRFGPNLRLNAEPHRLVGYELK